MLSKNQNLKKHLSASQITLYCECSLKHKFRYIDQIPKPQESIHLAYGSAIHEAFEYMNLNIGSLNLLDIYQAYHDSWVKETENMASNFYSDKLYNMGLYSLEKYFGEFIEYEPIEFISPEGARASAECQFNVPIIYEDGSEAEYTLAGVIDLVATRKGKIIILDYKTSKEDYQTHKVKTSIQLDVYAYAFRKMLEMGLFPKCKKKREDYSVFHVLVKDYDNLDGEIFEHKKVVGEKDITKLLYIIKIMLKGIQQEVFLPNYQDSCKYCEYRKECLDFKG